MQQRMLAPCKRAKVNLLTRRHGKEVRSATCAYQMSGLGTGRQELDGLFQLFPPDAILCRGLYRRATDQHISITMEAPVT